MSSTHVRDDGIRRVSSITRWVAALGVAATGSAPADPNAGGFQAPAVAPTPVYQAPMVRSGAS